MVEILSKLFATLEEGKLISHFFKIESKSFDFQYISLIFGLSRKIRIAR